ncbi:outer membrane beta-barrel protein, partial [Falsiroseomonas sp. HW251]|uniref:outer membrane beta-barrel protein n=1 Tax=Falsiroseomonas sp. HW251 TaxID=3390998 RepID=UPI003D31ED3E
MSLRKALLAATILSLPVAAEAQQVRGIYVGGAIGWNWLDSADVTTTFPTNPARSGSGNTKFDVGFAGVGSVGWGFGNGLRAEFEVNYRNNDVDSMRVSNVGFGPGSNYAGNAFSWGFMVNAFYDFNLGWPVVPYVGAGIGTVIQNWNNIRQSNQANGSNYLHVVGTNSVFAYQGIVGVAYPLADVPGLAFTAEYRAIGALDGSRDAYYYPGLGAGARSVGNADTTNGFTQSLLFGLRYNFGQRPAPVPAPAVAPAPAR